MTTATATQTVTCRLAQPEEGPVIGELVRRNAGASWDWINWDTIGMNWLIAEMDGTPVGCMMFSLGNPIARTDMLSVDPSLSKRKRAVIARDLGYMAWAICRDRGAQAVLMMIEWSKENEWIRIAMRRGAMPYAEGVLLVKPVKGGQS